MYDKVCKICGKQFQAVNKNYCICSPECRKINARELHRKNIRKYNETTKGQEKIKQYYKEHRVLVNKVCVCCGVKLNDGRQTYCLECLLKDHKDNSSTTSMKRLYSRGFDRDMVEEELERMKLNE